MPMRAALRSGVLIMNILTGPALAWPHPTLGGAEPIIIAHRGAPGHLPEHTLAGYALAIELGADYIEPDLVMTKDGHLIGRHDYYLSGSTDIAEHPEFADRRRSFDGREDWFVEDFTLAELRTLRARQAFPGRSTAFDDRWQIPTFDEILDLLREREAATGRRIGVYPETKHPGHFAALGLDFVAPLLDTLRKHGFGDSKQDAVFIQSFEPDILRRLDAATDYRLILLLEAPAPRGDAPLAPAMALEEAAEFVDGVGPSKDFLTLVDGSDSGFIAAAHALGLAVHIWTLRDDRVAEGFAGPAAEYARMFELGIDGMFTDFAGSGALHRGLARLRPEPPCP